METPRGDFLVGPDNGILMPAASRLGGITRVHQLTSAQYRLPVISSSFHGRDLFAPAAAHLAMGLPLEFLGPALDPRQLMLLDWPEPQVFAGILRSQVIYLDTFGNVKLSALAPDLGAALGAVGYGERVWVRLTDVFGSNDVEVTWVETFGRVGVGQPLLHEDSYGRLSLAINQGSGGAGDRDPGGCRGAHHARSRCRAWTTWWQHPLVRRGPWPFRSGPGRRRRGSRRSRRGSRRSRRGRTVEALPADPSGGQPEQAWVQQPDGSWAPDGSWVPPLEAPLQEGSVATPWPSTPADVAPADGLPPSSSEAPVAHDSPDGSADRRAGGCRVGVRLRVNLAALIRSRYPATSSSIGVGGGICVSAGSASASAAVTRRARPDRLAT